SILIPTVTRQLITYLANNQIDKEVAVGINILKNGWIALKITAKSAITFTFNGNLENSFSIFLH
ncbi:hypothetical protein, partial [Mycoplasmopsis bovis]|uniref:hypothetical protein n=1 Tax=Mycoplasmopsis bovis TaxID=28903 RepID=UPI003D2A9DBA